MYRIKDLKNGKFQIHSKMYGAFEGSKESIIRKALDWKLDFEDLFYAFSCFLQGDDYADFGVFGRFITSHKIERLH